ncbi:MAG TPA: hypothetical protein VF316_09685, partial [Polyangiaceae bacterium]
STLNLSEIVRYVESRGWAVIWRPEDHIEKASSSDSEKVDLPLMTVRKGALTVSLPSTWLGRLASEYLAPRTIVDALDACAATGRNNVEATFFNFAREADQWD